MYSKLSRLAVAAAFLLAQGAAADILWDQSDYDEFGPGFFNAEAGGPPFGMTVHAVCDVTVPAAGWNVESITTWYSALDPAWGAGIASGFLHIFPKTGALPVDGSDDPTASAVVPMSGTLVGTTWVVTASGLGVNLAAGDYWIGITPSAPSGPFGPEIYLSSLTPMGDATASYDVFAFPGPAAWFNFNPGVDASILIEGTEGGSTATEQNTWGGVKALFNN